ncbi:hypothetical protein [Micromonospora carbonacea]|uniref:Uncharacterized protein n=1 Tax=Micromonospora carbonacea TaxID=47853 RepID=A0A7H8XCT7_9ACTN|nr:hypothetical protein [Micromonospora carbonacea]MBB5823858.1 hypothetical protein [Micromonospora carbonacea]QLD22823.1 hypothetical protein HXZ27_29640 [Micromonospora carbonacea]
MSTSSRPYQRRWGMGDTGQAEGSRGEQIQQAEREAARRRILAQAEQERIPAEETTRALPDRRWRRERP